MNRGIIAAAVVVIVTVAVIVVSLSSRSSRNDEEEEAQQQAQSEETQVSEEAERTKRKNKGPHQGRRKGPRWGSFQNDLADQARKQGLWNPPRPLRLVVSYGGGRRSEVEARRIVDDARQRFMDGESSMELIRELSDAPRGIPTDLIRRFSKLPPDQASPVFPIENGFALFFGTPEAPPEGSTDAGAQDQ